MANIEFKGYVAPAQNAIASTLADFIKEGLAQGFTLQKPKGSKSVVFLSKAGNPQFLFLNKEQERVYVRISSNLDAALKAGEKVKLEESPVYNVNLDNGGKMLVVGMKAEAQEFEAVDPKTAFSGQYLTAEPA